MFVGVGVGVVVIGGGGGTCIQLTLSRLMLLNTAVECFSSFIPYFLWNVSSCVGSVYYIEFGVPKQKTCLFV